MACYLVNHRDRFALYGTKKSWNLNVEYVTVFKKGPQLWKPRHFDDIINFSWDRLIFVY
jgi:hypothetical protein